MRNKVIATIMLALMLFALVGILAGNSKAPEPISLVFTCFERNGGAAIFQVINHSERYVSIESRRIEIQTTSGWVRIRKVCRPEDALTVSDPFDVFPPHTTNEWSRNIPTNSTARFRAVMLCTIYPSHEKGWNRQVEKAKEYLQGGSPANIVMVYSEEFTR